MMGFSFAGGGSTSGALWGSLAARPCGMMGVMTMKMMRSTSTTSTSGVTLISARTPPLAWRFETRRRRGGVSPACFGCPVGRGGKGLTLDGSGGVALEDRVDELGRGLVDVDGDVVEPRREV